MYRRKDHFLAIETKNADNLKFIAEGNVLYYKEALINDLHKKEIGENGNKKLNTNYSIFFNIHMRYKINI